MQRYIKFMRFTAQGTAIASFGTIGVSPSWGGFIVGISSFFMALALLTLEKGD